MRLYRRTTSLVAAVVLVGLWGAPGPARPGERPHRLSEAAPTNDVDQVPAEHGHHGLPSGVVDQKLLGNLADTDLDGTLEPCVLKGACNGRQPTSEPAVVEGVSPVPMAVTRTAEATPPTATTYPRAGATDVYEDVVVKVVFSTPMTGVDATTWTLTDAQGTAVPASVAQISDGAWGLFPHQVFLTRGETYTAWVAAAVCDFAKICLAQTLTWRFTITATPGGGQGNTSIPLGGSPPAAGEETKTSWRSTAPGKPPGDGPPTQTARP